MGKLLEIDRRSQVKSLYNLLHNGGRFQADEFVIDIGVSSAQAEIPESVGDVGNAP